jgi:hypothetical protein
MGGTAPLLQWYSRVLVTLYVPLLHPSPLLQITHAWAVGSWHHQFDVLVKRTDAGNTHMTKQQST